MANKAARKALADSVLPFLSCDTERLCLERLTDRGEPEVVHWWWRHVVPGGTQLRMRVNLAAGERIDGRFFVEDLRTTHFAPLRLT